MSDQNIEKGLWCSRFFIQMKLALKKFSISFGSNRTCLSLVKCSNLVRFELKIFEHLGQIRVVNKNFRNGYIRIWFGWFVWTISVGNEGSWTRIRLQCWWCFSNLSGWKIPSLWRKSTANKKFNKIFFQTKEWKKFTIKSELDATHPLNGLEWYRPNHWFNINTTGKWKLWLIVYESFSNDLCILKFFYSGFGPFGHQGYWSV